MNQRINTQVLIYNNDGLTQKKNVFHYPDTLRAILIVNNTDEDEDGTLQILIDGVHIGNIGPGESFSSPQSSTLPLGVTDSSRYEYRWTAGDDATATVKVFLERYNEPQTYDTNWLMHVIGKALSFFKIKI